MSDIISNLIKLDILEDDNYDLYYNDEDNIIEVTKGVDTVASIEQSVEDEGIVVNIINEDGEVDELYSIDHTSGSLVKTTPHKTNSELWEEVENTYFDRFAQYVEPDYDEEDE